MKISFKPLLIKEDIEKIKKYLNIHNSENLSPLHIFFLDRITNNYYQLKEFFKQNRLNHKIYYSLKANRSEKIVKKIRELKNIGIEVSSEGELNLVLKNKFIGEEIISQGPKNKKYFEKSINKNCLFVVNSLEEFKIIEQIKKPINILIRLGNLNLENYFSIETRFGIDENQLNYVFKKLTKNKLINLRGFSFHVDSTSDDLKKEYLKKTISFILRFISKGFKIDTINIGGGWRFNYIDKNTWIKFNNFIARQVINKNNEYFWKKYNFGFFLEKERIVGEGNFYPYFSDHAYEQFKKIFHFSINSTPSINLIRDLNIKVVIESGRYLLNQVGHTLAQIIEVGSNNFYEYMNIDMKSNDIAASLDIIYDPILIRKNFNKSATKKSFFGFIFSNLCLEDDLIYKRKIYLEEKPNNGDCLIFPNTAAYKMGIFESPFVSLKLPERIVID